MKQSSRITVLIISLLMIVTYFVPIWFIDLEAPQYPEGLGMKIWLSKISGDLGTINGLNHYIGMKTIHPESIPELTIMPYLIASLIFSGIIVFIARKKWLFIIWALFFVAIGLTGLVDFYLWGYDYGHNLDPRAAIKVPGMSYQPPVIGSKQLLNFTAHSYPDIGGIIIMGGAIISLFLLFIETGLFALIVRLFKHENTSSLNHKSIASLLIIGFMLTSCSIDQQPINYGHDQCAWCKMTIADSRFGTELLTKKGKVYKFDSIECLINFEWSNEVEQENVHSSLITDFETPGNLVSAETAFYCINSSIQSPMGANLSAFAKKITALEFQKKHGGDILNWERVNEEISQEKILPIQ